MAIVVHKPHSPVLQYGHPLARDLRGAWLFYEGAGTVIHGKSPQFINGVYNGSSANDDWTVGPWGRSFAFTSADSELIDCVENGSDAAGIPRDLVGGFPGATIIAIVKVTADSNRKFVFHDTRSINNTRLRIEVNTSEAVVFGARSNTEAQQTLTSTTTLDSEWHSICAVANIAADQMRLFIDGVEESGSPSSVTFTNSETFTSFTTTNVKIGSDGNEGNFFNGEMAALLVWGRVFGDQLLGELIVDPFAAYRVLSITPPETVAATGMLNKFGAMRGGIASGRYGEPMAGGMRQ